MLDNLRKFNEKEYGIDDYYATYGENEYQKYDNSFTGLNEQQKEDLKKVKLSYTKVDTFYHCPFKYYLTYILRASKDEDDSDSIKVGNIFHYVLSVANKDDFDFEAEYNHIVNEQMPERDIKTDFFLAELKEELIEDIEIIKEQNSHSLLKKERYEKEIKVQVADNVVIDGLIDKSMSFSKDGITNIAIVDYKTGNTKVDLNNVEYGFSLQLPIYLYLMKHNDELTEQEVKYCGFYLQHIINGNLQADSKGRTLAEVKKDSMKLEGYSTNNQDRLELLDDTFLSGKSEVINSVSLNKDGSFSKTSKVLSDEQIDMYVNVAEEKIKEAAKEITSGNFPITRKYLKNKNVSCAYCEYQDLCYLRADDRVDLDNSLEMDDEEEVEA